MARGFQAGCPRPGRHGADSAVFAAFNAYGHQDRGIKVYDFNGHESGGEQQ
ncbi:hypothetical protein [Streptacidiphilus sp. PAMC 29251]